MADQQLPALSAEMDAEITQLAKDSLADYNTNATDDEKRVTEESMGKMSDPEYEAKEMAEFAEIFNANDGDNDGRITLDEWRNMQTTIGAKAAEKGEFHSSALADRYYAFFEKLTPDQ